MPILQFDSASAPPVSLPTLDLRTLRAQLAQVDGLLLILLAVPWLLLVANPGWIYGRHYFDSCLYWGFYVDLRNHLSCFSEHYYGSRLSVILPGWLAYKVLPPTAAHFTLHLGLYYLATGALYLTLKHAVGRRAAFLTTLLLGTHFFFLEAAAWDYVDGFGVSYCLLMVYLLNRGARGGRWDLWLVAAGMAGAALVVANPVFTVLLAFACCPYLVANRLGCRSPLVASAACFLLGAALVLLALAVFSKAAGGPFWFLSSTLRFLRENMGSPNHFRLVPPLWLPAAGWLLFPVVVALGAILLLVRTAWRRHGSVLPLVWQMQLLLLLLLLGVVECSPSSIYLQSWFYATPLLVPFTFLALGGQVAKLVERLTESQFRGLTGVGILTLAGSVVQLPPSLNALPAGFLFGGLVLGGLAVVLLRWEWRGVTGGILVVVLFAGVNFILQHDFRLELSSKYLRPVASEVHALDTMRRDMFLARAAAMRAIQEEVPKGRIWFWHNDAEFCYGNHPAMSPPRPEWPDEPLGVFFTMLASIHGGWFSQVNYSFPALPPGGWVYGGGRLEPGMKLVILSSLPGDAQEAARPALQELGLEARMLRMTPIRQGRIAFLMTFIEITKANANSKDRAAMQKQVER